MEAAPTRGRQLDRSRSRPPAGGSPVPGYARSLSRGVSPGVASSSTSANVFDAIEREQEAVVNRLQREIDALKEQGARSRSSSLSSTASNRSTSCSRAPVVAPRTTDLEMIHQLRRENEALRKQLSKMTALLAEKEAELARLRT